MNKKDFIIIFYCLFICVNCFCDGDHNRVDLNKDECAKYDIEKTDISSGNVEDFECCYVSMLNNIMASECMTLTKDEAERMMEKAFELSSLNVFDYKIECSSKNLIVRIINMIKSLVLLF